VVYAREWWLFIKKPLRVGVSFLEAIVYLLIRAVVSKVVVRVTTQRQSLLKLGKGPGS